MESELVSAETLLTCNPGCDQLGTQLDVFRRLKSIAASANRRPPHCMLYLNTDYLWPFDLLAAGAATTTTTNAGTNNAGTNVDIRILDIHGNPHVETCDPGLFPSYLYDYSKPAAVAAWVAGNVKRGLDSGFADGFYADCYINKRLECNPPGSNHCYTVGNGTTTHQPMYNNAVTAEQARDWFPGKKRAMAAAAALAAEAGGSFFSKMAPLNQAAPYGGNMNWIWLPACWHWPQVWRTRGCTTAGCPIVTPEYLIQTVKTILANYSYAVLGTDADLPTSISSPWRRSTGFVSFCGETATALFLLALEPGCFLLCQGWDERFGLELGLPTGPATLNVSDGSWSREFKHGTSATWKNGAGVVRWRAGR